MRIKATYYFTRPRSWCGYVISILSLSPWSHVYIKLETSQWSIYYTCDWRGGAQWFSSAEIPVPYDGYEEVLETGPSLIDKALPGQERYSIWGSLLGFWTRLPIYPLNCVTAVHRLRRTAGLKTRGRSPRGLRKFFRKSNLTRTP